MGVGLPWAFQGDERSPIGLASGPRGHFLHDLRADVRARGQRAAMARKWDPEGLAHVDVGAVRAALRPKQCKDRFGVRTLSHARYG